jgi:YHS domain-containing protein
MKLLGRAMLLVLVPVALAAQQPEAPPDALDGLDAVLLVQGKEVEGRSAFTVVHGPFTYLFSSAETKAAFQRAPAKYEIQMGGLCARMGRTTGANPADYLVHNGKIYVFGSDECHKRFAANPEKYLPPARKPMTTSAAATAKGQQLLDAAALALGDPTLIDAMTSYAETFARVQKRMDGEATVTTKTIWSFPSRVRQERSMAFSGKTMGAATVLSPTGMWYLGNAGQVYSMPAAGRSSLEMDFGRHPIALLKARKAAGFAAAATGRTDVGGVALDRVRVVKGGLDVTLNLDPQRRIHSVTFTDRNAEGIYGTYAVMYSDYRPVQKLTLPYTVRALFNGEPDPQQSFTLDSIAINPPADPSLFTPKAAADGK